MLVLVYFWEYTAAFVRAGEGGPMRKASVAGAIVLTTLFAGGGTAAMTAAPVPAMAESAIAAVNSNNASELIIDNNYPALYGWINSKLGNATVIKVKATCGISNSGDGTTVIPAQVTDMMGWQESFLSSEKGLYDRQLGYADSYESLTFEKGAKTTLDHLTIKCLKDKVVVPAGTQITFKNCTFTNRIVVEKGARATFENCTFSSGTILNNGKATYSGSTKEPKNEGKAETDFQELALTADTTSFDNAMHGYAYSQDIALNLTGTGSDTAKLSAKINQADSGLSAKIDGKTLTISGTPAKTGTVTTTVTATAPNEDGSDQTKTLTVTVNVTQRYTFELSGTLDAVRSGQGDYADTTNHALKVTVVAEDGTRMDYYDFSCSDEGKDAKLKPFITPDGAGINANFYNAATGAEISLGGTAGNAGTYQVGATVTIKGQTIKTNTAELRIYSGQETLKGQIGALVGKPSDWNMEPYEINRSDNAVIPTWLHHIYGSHQSGLYGQIGNAQDAFASDTLTIPAGANVTLENIKVNSSVKIVVEKGAKLTITDSSVFGPIEVNGGTLAMNNSSSTESTITLNDGATLENSEVISHAQFLTDGRKPVPAAPASVVIVNGNVTFKGQNSIKADQSQIGLEVNGNATITDSSKLTITGGNGGTAPGEAASAIKLNGGTISGKGTLQATGGGYEVGGNGIPAIAVDGTGTLSTDKLILKGGDAGTIFGTKIDGANAGVKTVVVTTAAAGRDITGGKGINGGADGIGEDSVTIKDAIKDAKSDQNNASDNKSNSSEKHAPKKKTGVLPATGDPSVFAAAATAFGAIATLGGGLLARRKE